MMEDIKSKDSKYDERSDKYTQILSNFVENISSAAKTKGVLKITFFYSIIIMLILFTLVFVGSLIFAFYLVYNAISGQVYPTETFFTAIVSLLSSLGAVVISLLKLPEIIAKYLFNPEEDRDTITIVEKIQQYDISMYDMEHKIESLLMDEQISDNDKEISEESTKSKTPEDKNKKNSS